MSLNRLMGRKIFFELDLSPISDRDLIPPEIVIYLTSKCSYADCGHCIIKENFANNYLSLEMLKKIFVDMKELEIPFVSFTGGEPFEYEDGLENAVALANENDLFVNQIITNAFFAKDKNGAMVRLKELRDAGFSAIKLKDKWIVPSLTISMDKEHQKFIPLKNVKNLINAAKKVFGKFIDITVNYVLFEENKEEVLKRNPWLKDVNIDFGNVCYEGRAKKLKNKRLVPIKNHLKDWDSPCNWMNTKWPTVPAIFPDGRINFCCYFGLKLSLGNIKKNSLREALSKINSDKLFLTLFKYGPVKLFYYNKCEIKEKYTYGKCGFCNILLKNLYSGK